MDVLLVIMVQQVTLKAFMSHCVFVWAMITEQVTGTNLGEFSETQVTAQWLQRQKQGFSVNQSTSFSGYGSYNLPDALCKVLYSYIPYIVTTID